MSDQSPYETLGLDETSSFDEIQTARSQLISQVEGDHKQVETIEAAYDAILMDRLRLRQEGKIDVPDQIRFPAAPAEKTTESNSSGALGQAKGWFQQFLDTPERTDILWPAGIYAGLVVLSIFNVGAIPLALAVGIGANVYFLNRKENKLGRSVLLTVASLCIGLVIGFQVAALLMGQVSVGTSDPIAEQNTLTLEAAVFTFFVFWLTSSFLR